MFTDEPADVQRVLLRRRAVDRFRLEVRLRGSLVYASGDSDPFDNRETGFDAIFENPQIAGSDTNYWIRQGIL